MYLYKTTYMYIIKSFENFLRATKKELNKRLEHCTGCPKNSGQSIYSHIPDCGYIKWPKYYVCPMYCLRENYKKCRIHLTLWKKKNTKTFIKFSPYIKPCITDEWKFAKYGIILTHQPWCNTLFSCSLPQNFLSTIDNICKLFSFLF